MPFPASPRVIYAVNPLDEVVCELRFPTILKIDAESPASFQEAIRAEYPKYERKPRLRLPDGIPAELAQSIAAEMPLGAPSPHVFGSRDANWHLNLTRQSMWLSCKSYERWEVFKQRFAGAYAALLEQYRPAFFTRLGLRYRDVVRRSALDLNEENWGRLLQPWVGGVLGASTVEGEVYGTESVCGIRLPDSAGQVQVRFGLAIEDRPEGKGTEEVFLIDADFSWEHETEPSNVLDRLDSFHIHAGRLFRWCITDRLHEALRPGPVPPI